MLPDVRLALETVKESVMADRCGSHGDEEQAPEEDRMSGPREDMGNQGLSCSW